MSRRPLSDVELEELLYQSSDSEAADNIECDNNFSDSDSDDSVGDPDFIPEDNDIDDAFGNDLVSLWSKPCIDNVPKRPLKRDLAQNEPSTSCILVSCFTLFGYIFLLL